MIKGLWKKRLLNKVWIVFAAITLVASVIFLVLAQETPKSVIYVKFGSVNVTDKSTSKLIPANVGDELSPGNKIITGSNGTAQIRLDDGSFLSMQENTSVEIVAFYANPWQGMQVIQFHKEYGDILINTGDNEKSLYEITTNDYMLSVAEGVCRLTNDGIKPLTEDCNVVVKKKGKTINVPFETELKITENGNIIQKNNSKISNEDKALLLRAKPRLEIDENPIVSFEPDIVISGVSNPGNVISVDATNSVTASSNGRFRIEIKDHPVGEVERIVTSRDNAGRETSVNVIIRREKTAEMNPHKLELHFPVDNSVVDSPTILVSGEVQGSEKIEINGINVPFEGNTFEYNYQLSIGRSVIEVVSKDEFGNTIIKRRNIERVQALKTANLKIKEPENGFTTTDENIKVSGTANTTQVYFKGKTYKVLDGRYTIDVSLKDGDNMIVIVAKDDDHKEKLEEIVITKVARSTPEPKIIINDYKNITNKSSVDIHGKVENVSQLSEGSNNITINADGTFDVYHLMLSAGENQFEIIATSPDGKNTKQIINIIYDNIPPDLSKIKATRDPKTGNVTISGLIESLAKFEVNGLDYSESAINTNPEMNQSSILEVIENHKGNSVSIKATDLAGNISSKEVPIETTETP